MSQKKPNKTKNISRHAHYCGYRDLSYFEILNAREVSRACDAYFIRKGMPLNEHVVYGGYGKRKP